MDPHTVFSVLIASIILAAGILTAIGAWMDGCFEGFQFMRAFNSFQIVAAFVAWPFLIAWLQDATFRGAPVAFYAACALYVVAFFAMVFCVYKKLGKEEK